MTNRYYVIARVYADEVKCWVDVIAGEFDSFINAKLFKDAYNQHYSADARIEDRYTLLQASK